MWIGHHKEIWKLTFRALALPRSKPSKSLYGGQFTLSTRLRKPSYLVILPPMQHHRFFRNVPPLWGRIHTVYLCNNIASGTPLNIPLANCTCKFNVKNRECLHDHPSQRLMIKCITIIQIEWNLKMLVFEERGKPENPEKNLSEQGRQPTTNSTHVWHRVRGCEASALLP